MLGLLQQGAPGLVSALQHLDLAPRAPAAGASTAADLLAELESVKTPPADIGISPGLGDGAAASGAAGDSAAAAPAGVPPDLAALADAEPDAAAEAADAAAEAAAAAEEAAATGADAEEEDEGGSNPGGDGIDGDWPDTDQTAFNAGNFGFFGGGTAADLLGGLSDDEGGKDGAKGGGDHGKDGAAKDAECKNAEGGSKGGSDHSSAAKGASESSAASSVASVPPSSDAGSVASAPVAQGQAPPIDVPVATSEPPPPQQAPAFGPSSFPPGLMPGSFPPGLGVGFFAGSSDGRPSLSARLRSGQSPMEEAAGFGGGGFGGGSVSAGPSPRARGNPQAAAFGRPPRPPAPGFGPLRALSDFDAGSHPGSGQPPSPALFQGAGAMGGFGDAAAGAPGRSKTPDPMMQVCSSMSVA